jgi:HK97 family phage major capsid protein
MNAKTRQHLTALREERAAVWEQMKGLSDTAAAESRDLTAGEYDSYNRLEADYRAKGAEIDRLEREVGEDDTRNLGRERMLGGERDERGGAVVLARGQRMADWGRRRGLRGYEPSDDPRLGTEGAGSFDRLVRGLVTGDWDGAEQELRAVTESPLTAGGHMVPTPLALDVIDRARNSARVFQAGALTVPMTSSTLKMARLTSEATPAWRNEGAAISDQAMAFDSVTFTARSMAMLVKISFELFEDAPSSGTVIADSFAKQIGLELDRVALRGSGTAPEPRGIRNQSGVTLLSHGANGDTIANLKYNMLVDSIAAVRAANFEPNAIIDAPRTEQGLAKLVDSTGQYIVPPAALANIPRLPTNQVPTNLTVGTSTDCSEVYTGQFDQLMIGLRTGFTIKFLGERFADDGMYAFLAYLRGDVQLAQPAAFAVDLGVRG